MHRWMALATLLMLLTVACSGQDDESTPTPAEGWGPEPPGSPQAFVDRLGMAVDRDGTVYHATVTATGTESGEQPVEFLNGELWIDAAEERARRVIKLGPPDPDIAPDQTTYVVAGAQTYTQRQDEEATVSEDAPEHACPQVDVPATLHQALGSFCASLISQPGAGDDLSARIDADAEFEGSPAVALVYEAEGEAGSDSTPEAEVGRFYLSPDNWLPIGWTVEMIEPQDGAEIELSATYDHQFLNHDELPDDFFAPPTDQITE